MAKIIEHGRAKQPQRATLMVFEDGTHTNPIEVTVERYDRPVNSHERLATIEVDVLEDPERLHIRVAYQAEEMTITTEVVG